MVTAKKNGVVEAGLAAFAPVPDVMGVAQCETTTGEAATAVAVGQGRWHLAAGSRAG